MTDNTMPEPVAYTDDVEVSALQQHGHGLMWPNQAVASCPSISLYTAEQLQAERDRAERAEKERDQLRAGVKRMSDEEELQSETSDGVGLSAAHFAAKLAAAEKELADAERMCDSYADENQRLHDRATTAEAALADARKVIEGPTDAVADLRVRNGSPIRPAYYAGIKWLSAHPAKETKG